jgi:U3 small nucleolar RNA-associated protein MPP10
MFFQVIEDMSIQANVPALAMEEVQQHPLCIFYFVTILLSWSISKNYFCALQIAPVAVSDAAMLAPEEIFGGKGDVKEEAELTQAERKRKRANKKRRYAGSFVTFGLSGAPYLSL